MIMCMTVAWPNGWCHGDQDSNLGDDFKNIQSLRIVLELLFLSSYNVWDMFIPKHQNIWLDRKEKLNCVL